MIQRVRPRHAEHIWFVRERVTWEDSKCALSGLTLMKLIRQMSEYIARNLAVVHMLHRANTTPSSVSRSAFVARNVTSQNKRNVIICLSVVAEKNVQPR